MTFVGPSPIALHVLAGEDRSAAGVCQIAKWGRMSAKRTDNQHYKPVTGVRPWTLKRMNTEKDECCQVWIWQGRGGGWTFSHALREKVDIFAHVSGSTCFLSAS